MTTGISSSRLQLPKYFNQDSNLTLEQRRHWHNFKLIRIYAILTILGFIIGFHLSTNKSSDKLDLSIGYNNATTPSEIFEVTLPHANFGEPVYQQVLLTHLFADSWGKPAIGTYTAPPLDIDFNKVVLTINTTVNGVQYDRLAHVYLDGIALWRTSTIEPGNKEVFSTASKDVSIYAKLFKMSSIPIMFQLDNLVTRRLTGAFNITLEATYYNAPQNISIVPKALDDELSSPGTLKHFFGNSDPADQIWSMVTTAPNRPPLVYQPSSDLKMLLPTFNANTTRAKIDLFMSGNAAEEFWYTNVMDNLKDSFSDHGHQLLGHGPCRIANIFLDDLKIATLMPEPTIYTGGISPALWRPIVASGAFDVRALEIELTPLLPLLWEHSKKELRIEIGNCVDDMQDRKPSSIGENWITTANILTWESSKVLSSSGSMVGNYTDTKSGVVEFGDTPSMTQIVHSKYDTYVKGELNYQLTNGSTINVYSDSLTSLRFSNVQNYESYGDIQLLVSDSTSHHSFAISDTDTDDLIAQTNITHNFPLVVSIMTRPMGRDVAYDVTLVRGTTAVVKFMGSHDASILVKSIQNGTSSYYLSPKGNHGTGKTEHRLRAATEYPLPKLHFKRRVVAEDGDVLHDEQHWKGASSEESSILERQIINDEFFDVAQMPELSDVFDHFKELVSDGVLDISSFEMMISQLAESLQEKDITENDWSSIDPYLLAKLRSLHFY